MTGCCVQAVSDASNNRLRLARILGILLGIGGAFALSRVTSSLLYGVSPSDPLTYGAVAIVIALVATAACIVPSHRATRVDPLEAIRAE